MTTLMPILRRNLWNWTDANIIDRFFTDFPVTGFLREDNEFLPNIDVVENEKDIVVKAEIPGMNKDEIEITLTEGLLTIAGEKKQEYEEKKENYHLIERKHGTFRRSIRLPGEVANDKIDATYKDGVLKVVVPKAEETKPKKIEVH